MYGKKIQQQGKPKIARIRAGGKISVEVPGREF
jgi:hypothetical protein